MIKGGYKIVNFKGTALSGTPADMPGIYDQIVDDYNKPIMVSGVSLNGTIMDDAYADVQEKTVEGSKIVELTVYGGVITVTEDDEVTFAIAMSNTELSNNVSYIMSHSIMKVSEELLTGDINDAADGWSCYSSTSSNRPASGPIFVLTISVENIKCQIGISSNLNQLYTRTAASGIWTTWGLATNS